MGYYTSFSGVITIEPTLKPEHKAYLTKFCESRRMQRDPIVTAIAARAANMRGATTEKTG